jgi:hypothetical protein
MPLAALMAVNLELATFWWQTANGLTVVKAQLAADGLRVVMRQSR